ncbi:MAG: carbohydrate binding domain-containing protein, partial [Lentisphaerota bacterium]
SRAGTAEQKKRAEYLKMLFEMSDLAVTALFSEVILPEGRLASAEDAVEMLKDVPFAVKAAEKLRDMPRARWLCQDGGMYENKQGVDLSPYLANNLSMVLPFMDNGKVKAAMQELADNKDTPLLLRGQVKLWLGQAMKNLIENGSFEALSPLPNGNAKIVQKHKYSGENSLLTSNGSLKWRIPVQPDKTYLFSVRVFIPENSAEGLFDIRLASGENDKNITWLNQNPNRITAGQWNLFSSVITIPGAIRMIETANRLDIYLGFKNFEKTDNVYIDDVTLVCLDDIK